jgi:hypothetical protein
LIEGAPRQGKTTMAGNLTGSAFAGLSTAQQQLVQAAVSGQPFQTKWNSYYSRIRITSTSLDPAGIGYSVAAGGEYTAFGYSRNGDMTAAGQPGVQATPADTNILTANQTISGEMILILGIGIIALTQSDANLLKALDQCVSVKIKTNGTQEYLLGVPSMVPTPGGLFGASEALSVVPSLPDQLSRSVGVLGNGLPHVSNYFCLPEPMVWASSGQGDSNFNVIYKVERTCNTIDQYSGASRIAGVGVAPYTKPAFGSIWVDYMTVVIGVTVNPLSTS